MHPDLLSLLKHFILLNLWVIFGISSVFGQICLEKELQQGKYINKSCKRIKKWR